MEKHHFVFSPTSRDPESVAITKSFIDSHGRVLVPLDLVSPSHPLADIVVKPGDWITLDESQPHLLRFVETCKLFRRASYWEVHGDSGEK